ncbi:antibiotic biosynthesis monooxygenase family protein [Acidithiobacillus sp.]
MHYVVANRIPVLPEFREQFEERFRNRVGQAEKQPGFVRMEILRPEDPEGYYVVQTHWESKDAFNQWVGSEDFKAAHRNPMPAEAFRGPGELERHEVIISAEAAQ